MQYLYPSLLLLFVGSCAAPPAAVGRWHLDRAATTKRLDADPRSKRKIHPRVELLKVELDVRLDGSFTQTEALLGEPRPYSGTWVERDGRVRFTSDRAKCTATVVGQEMVLLYGPATADGWQFAVVLRRR